MNKKVLVIDDDLDMGKLIEAILKPLELSVTLAHSGAEGLKQAYMIHPDLIILDVMMPGMDGYEVGSRLREFSNMPILMLTARIYDKDLIHGFEVGVDDFLRKPFNKGEFEARVRALLKRSNNQDSAGESYINAYTDHVLEINLLTKTVKLLGNVVEFSPKEYDLLASLVREQGKVLSHRKLLQDAWGDKYVNDPAELSLYIHYLRNKLKDGQYDHKYIRTNWGRGYMFAPRMSDEDS